MQKSDTLKEIGKALSIFQTKMDKIKKDSKNPYFNSKYASLSTIQEAIQLPLAECDLVYSQLPDEDCLTTILIHHPSGEYLQSCYNIHPAKIDPQGIGSAITYARRYALSAILGLNVDDDDDGNAASQPTAPRQQANHAPNNTPGAKIGPNPSAEDNNLPWLNEKQYNDAISRINAGEFDLLDKLKGSFRMKRAWREAMEEAIIFTKSLAS